MTAIDAQAILYTVALQCACHRTEESRAAAIIVRKAAEELGDLTRPGGAAVQIAHAVITRDGERRPAA
jgi:hypothetical protein